LLIKKRHVALKTYKEYTAQMFMFYICSMKRNFLNCVSILLVLQVVVATVGLTVYNHTCHLMGMKEISLFEDKGCCADSEQPASQESNDCCEFSTDHVHGDLETVLHGLFSYSFNSVAVLPAIFTAIEWPSAFVTEELVLHFADSSPPPVYGRFLLYLIQALLL
jgi:hypothetical protein